MVLKIIFWDSVLKSNLVFVISVDQLIIHIHSVIKRSLNLLVVLCAMKKVIFRENAHRTKKDCTVKVGRVLDVVL